MVEGWKPVVIPEELYNAAKQYFEENKKELKLKESVRSHTGFIGYCLREYMKEKGII